MHKKENERNGQKIGSDRTIESWPHEITAWTSTKRATGFSELSTYGYWIMWWTPTNENAYCKKRNYSFFLMIGVIIRAFDQHAWSHLSYWTLVNYTATTPEIRFEDLKFVSAMASQTVVLRKYWRLLNEISRGIWSTQYNCAKFAQVFDLAHTRSIQLSILVKTMKLCNTIDRVWGPLYSSLGWNVASYNFVSYSVS